MSTAEQIIGEHRTGARHKDGRVWCYCGEILESPEGHAAHVVEALTNAGHHIVELPEVTRPEWYDAEVLIDGPGMNGARVVREGDQVSFLGVPCPVRAEVAPVFAAALLAVHQDANLAEGGAA